MCKKPNAISLSKCSSVIQLIKANHARWPEKDRPEEDKVCHFTAGALIFWKFAAIDNRICNRKSTDQGTEWYLPRTYICSLQVFNEFGETEVIHCIKRETKQTNMFGSPEAPSPNVQSKGESLEEDILKNIKIATNARKAAQKALTKAQKVYIFVLVHIFVLVAHQLQENNKKLEALQKKDMSAFEKHATRAEEHKYPSNNN